MHQNPVTGIGQYWHLWKITILAGFHSAGPKIQK